MPRSVVTLSRGPLLTFLLALALSLLFPSSVEPAFAQVLPAKKAALTEFAIAAADRARSFTHLRDRVAGRVWSDQGPVLVAGPTSNRGLRVTREPEDASAT